MFLQFSPGPKKIQKNVSVNKENDSPEILIMRPFSANPKLFFEDVKVGVTAIQKLLVQNPSSQDILVTIKNLPPAELKVDFNWVEKVIVAEKESLLEVTWNPSKVQSCRHVLHFSSNNFKKDIPVVFKAVAGKNTAQMRKKSSKLTVLSKTIKSPQKMYRKIKASPKNKVRPLPTVSMSSYYQKMDTLVNYTQENKENSKPKVNSQEGGNLSTTFQNVSALSDVFKSPDGKDASSMLKEADFRRQTYRIAENNPMPVRHETYIISETSTNNISMNLAPGDNVRRETFIIPNDLPKISYQKNLYHSRKSAAFSTRNSSTAANFFATQGDSVRRETFIVKNESLHRNNTYTIPDGSAENSRLRSDTFCLKSEDHTLRNLSSGKNNTEQASATTFSNIPSISISYEFNTPQNKHFTKDNFSGNGSEKICAKFLKDIHNIKLSPAAQTNIETNYGSPGQNADISNVTNTLEMQYLQKFNNFQLSPTTRTATNTLLMKNTYNLSPSPAAYRITDSSTVENPLNLANNDVLSNKDNNTYEVNDMDDFEDSLNEPIMLEEMDPSNTFSEKVLKDIHINNTPLKPLFDTNIRKSLHFPRSPYISSTNLDSSNKENIFQAHDRSLFGVDPLYSPISANSTPNVSYQGVVQSRRQRIPRNSSPLDQYQFRMISPHGFDVSNIESTSPGSKYSPRLTELSGSEAKRVIEANLWVTPRTDIKRHSTVLESIAEETVSGSFEKKPHCKRKIIDDDLFVISPPKRRTLNREEVSLISKCPTTKTWSIKTAVSTSTTAAAEERHPDIFSALLSDPFLCLTPKDETWIQQQEVAFKKWLNLLLSAPKELDTDVNSHPVDIVNLWQQCKKKDLVLASSKETVSSLFHVEHRLEKLRKDAKSLYNSVEISKVLKETIAFTIKKDIKICAQLKVHLDLHLQQELLCILLSYNPLWLRIGLETIFGCKIKLQSNSDIIGLSKFLVENLFKNERLFIKYGSHKLNNNYAIAMNHFVFSTFLRLVYFLDSAKTRKLIAHDPCLFCKNAPIKESKEALHAFSRLLLSALDLPRNLKSTGYIVLFKQSYLDEFDYSVDELGLDLRDGVRLTKLMEIILLQNNLGSGLRVPAISRLQKIHNVNIALMALEQSGYELLGDIEAHYVVDGYRQKTMSLLWQLINKFKAPRMQKAAETIQKWWRSLPVCLILLQKRKLLQARVKAAFKIQQWFRRIVLARKIEKSVPIIMHAISEERKRNEAVRIIQRSLRSFVVHRRIQVFVKVLVDRRNNLKEESAVIIQKRFRAYQSMKNCRESYQRLRSCVLNIQRRFRANQEMKICRQNYIILQAAAIIIQVQFRATKEMQTCRGKYLELRNAAIKIQRYFRANNEMKIYRDKYCKLKKATIRIQQWLRATMEMKKCRENYLELRKATITIQNQFRANKNMTVCRQMFLLQRKSAIVIQERFRAWKDMKTQREIYIRMKESAIVIQRRFRANVLMKIVRRSYLLQKDSVVKIQRHFRSMKETKKYRENYLKMRNAAIVIQNRLRANRLMITCRESFLKQKKSAILIQQHYRAFKLMKQNREDYLQLKNAACIIQRRYRAQKKMLSCKYSFEKQRNAAIIIQQRFRANILMTKVRQNYLHLLHATTTIQRRFRANQQMRKCLECYLNQRKAIIRIQQWYRATLKMKIQRTTYILQRKAAIKIQLRFRATVLMKIERKNYLDLKNAATKIQRKFRATLEMKKCKEEYLNLRKATFAIQHRFRANKKMITCRTLYLQKLESAVVIQQYFRAYKQMENCRDSYRQLKAAAIIVQRRFRAQKKMKLCRENYEKQRKAASLIQKYYKAYRIMKTCRANYLKQQEAAVVIQKHFRATKEMNISRKSYLQLKGTAITIQRSFRCYMAMKICRENYMKQKSAALVIQKWFRATMLLKTDQEKFYITRRAVLTIQRRFRANQQMLLLRKEYLLQRNAVITIQRFYNAFISMKVCRNNYLRLRISTVIVQQKFRATLQMRKDRNQFEMLKNAAIVVQRRFRANQKMRKCLQYYLNQRKAIVRIQQWYRTTLKMKMQRTTYLLKRKAAITIQLRFRATVLMKIERKNYLDLKNATTKIQRKFRATLEIKKCKEEYLNLRKAALAIQHRFRANKKMITCRTLYLQKLESAVVIQQYFRAYKQMKNCRDSYRQLEAAAIIVQRRFRAQKKMKLFRENYEKQRKAASIIQKYYRAYRSMKTCRANYLKQQEAAVVIQKHFRATKEMNTSKKSYLQLKGAAIAIQRRFRGYMAMKICRENYMKQKSAALVIQKWFRATMLLKSDQERFYITRGAVLTIQRRFRANQQMLLLRKEYLLQRNAVITIQHFYRAFISMKVCRNNYLRLRISTIIIQQKFRATLQMKKCRNQFEILKDSTIVLQRRFRANREMNLCKKMYTDKRNATIVIQQRFRAYIKAKSCRQYYLHLRNAAITVQRRFRAIQEMRIYKKRFEELKNATLKIQSRFRLTKEMEKCRRDYEKLRNAAIIIQARFRATKEAKLCVENYKKLVIATKTIQKLYRRKREVRICRENFLKLRNAKRAELNRKHICATKIQAAWRGYKTRSEEKVEMVQIRQKVKLAKEEARPENSVRSRVQGIMDILTATSTKNYVNIGQYNILLTRLYEITAKYCPAICLYVEEVDLIREILYELLDSVNRSEPHMAACVTATKILVHLLECPKQHDYNWCGSHTGAILNQMVAFCDKNDELFSNLCKLLLHMVEDSDRCELISHITGIHQKLSRIRALVIRKQSMHVKKQYLFNVCNFESSLLLFDKIFDLVSN